MSQLRQHCFLDCILMGNKLKTFLNYTYFIKYSCEMENYINYIYHSFSIVNILNLRKISEKILKAQYFRPWSVYSGLIMIIIKCRYSINALKFKINHITGLIS